MEAIGKAKLSMIKLTDGSAGFLMSIKVHIIMCLMIFYGLHKTEHLTQKNIKSKWIKNAFAQIEQNKYPSTSSSLN